MFFIKFSTNFIVKNSDRPNHFCQYIKWSYIFLIILIISCDLGAELIREGYPIFNAEEGQYLAAALGEPLIKGLTEVAQLRPKNPVIHLAQYLLKYDQEAELRKSIGSASDLENKNVEDLDDVKQNNDDSNKLWEEGDQKEGQDEHVAAVSEDKHDLEQDASFAKSVDQNDDDDDEILSELAFKPLNRDEHGQSMIHFAAARSHGRNAMLQLLQEMDGNIALRDSLYRTARDIAQNLEIDDNVKSIDQYVVSIAARAEDDKLKQLIVDGYDHILDAEHDRDNNIIDITKDRQNESTLKLLRSIECFEEKRDKLHRAIRLGSWESAAETFRDCNTPKRLAMAKNHQGRCALHIAVLSQNEDIVEQIAKQYPATLQLGDNLMRTPLHYAMGVDKVEPLSRILIAAGAQRVVKDLKGRQPSYYFMNKTDIQKLQDEEEELKI